MDMPSAELETYRTLRLGMVAGGLLLGTGVIGHIMSAGGQIPPSVSATFYTSIQTIFTGTLILVGLALVAVKGRPGWENTLLDVAGVVIPMVAFVPTPIQDATCVPAGKDCVPLPLVEGVGLNVGAYLILGLVALGYLWLRRLLEGENEEWDGPTTKGVAALSTVWLLIAATFFLARPQFLQYAHYASAISFFVILGAVVFINASYTAPVDPAIHKPASWYRGWYRVIAWLMVGFALFGVLVFAVTGTQNYVYTGAPSPFPVIFWVEVVLLTLFILYWILQTSELWNQTVPGSSPKAGAAPQG
ncbi:MAG TPA: hypothetical protein VFW55_10025 [Propionicimonas sp.]|nr:hypothetical protein [Propionicimonas sp.]